MGLVRLIGADGSPVYVRADLVTGIGRTDKGSTAIKLSKDEAWLVQGTPDDVHAALFSAGQTNTSGVPFSELVDALDPHTYETEWQQHSPQCVRAMSHALGLVRSRLGVLLDMTPEKKR